MANDFNNNHFIEWNSQTCEDSSMMIFYDKKDLCNNNVLNPPKPRITRRFFASTKKSDNKLIYNSLELQIIKDNWKSINLIPNNCIIYGGCNTQLVGYYIQPEANNSPTRMYFLPVWMVKYGSDVFEVVTNPIILNFNHYEVSPNTISSNLSGVLISATQSPQDLINHPSFQFNDLAIQKGFEKAFISYYELLSIIQNCDYLGITGALVASGNLVPVPYTQANEEIMTRTCNKFYFTYRFVGFKIEPEGTCFPQPIGGTICLRKSNVEINKNRNNGSVDVTFNAAIPTETWAVPCPPMWKP